jgi:hypothetical protein
MSTSRKRDGRNLTDAEVESADAWHWISAAEASARLLARLIEHHTNKSAAGSEPAAFEEDGPARPAHAHQSAP